MCPRCVPAFSWLETRALPCGRCLRGNLLPFLDSDFCRPDSPQAAKESFRSLSHLGPTALCRLNSGIPNPAKFPVSTVSAIWVGTQPSAGRFSIWRRQALSKDPNEVAPAVESRNVGSSRSEEMRRRARYWRLRNCCRLSAAFAIDRAKLSFATLWANTLLITSSSAEVRYSWAWTTSTLSVTPA